MADSAAELYEQLIDGETVTPTEARASLDDTEFLDLIDGDNVAVRYDEDEQLVEIHPTALDDRNANRSGELTVKDMEKVLKAPVNVPVSYYEKYGLDTADPEEWDTEDLEEVSGSDVDTTDMVFGFSVGTTIVTDIAGYGALSGCGMLGLAVATGEPIFVEGGMTALYSTGVAPYLLPFQALHNKTAKRQLRDEYNKRKAREKAEALENEGYVIVADTNAAHDEFEEQWPEKKLVDRYTELSEADFRSYISTLCDKGELTEIMFAGNEVAEDGRWLDAVLEDDTYRVEEHTVEQYETASGTFYRAILRGAVDIGDLEPDYVECGQPLLEVAVSLDSSSPEEAPEPGGTSDTNEYAEIEQADYF